jgi:hypothetical protein
VHRQPLRHWADPGGSLRQIGWIADQDRNSFSCIPPFYSIQFFYAAPLSDQGSQSIYRIGWEGHQPAGTQELNGFWKGLWVV